MLFIRRILWLAFFAFCCTKSFAQELDARVTVNHSKVQGTNTSVFDDLEKNITEFLNNRRWTGQQYEENERINCSFNITINKYDDARGSFTGSLLLMVIRPVYNSSYTTVEYSVKDEDFDFTYHEFDKLEFRVDQINNDLTAMLGYYAYLIIGIDNDTMSVIRMAPVFDNNRSLLFDMDIDQLKNTDWCISTCAPRFGTDFISTARGMLTDDIRHDVEALRDFSFEQHPNIKAEEARLEALSTIVREQVNR